jgi:hypothetical protein
MSLVYRVAQEERAVFWEVIVSVILSKKVRMYVCHIDKVNYPCNRP